MLKIIHSDAVFGELENDGSFMRKHENMFFWGKNINFKIVIRLTGKGEIKDIQRQNYEYFKSELLNISEESLRRVREFIIYSTQEEIWASPEDLTAEDITDEYVMKVVDPLRVLFQPDGRFGILCGYAWNTYFGLGIKIKPEWEIGPQDCLC